MPTSTLITSFVSIDSAAILSNPTSFVSSNRGRLWRCEPLYSTSLKSLLQKCTSKDFIRDALFIRENMLDGAAPKVRMTPSFDCSKQSCTVSQTRYHRRKKAYLQLQVTYFVFKCPVLNEAKSSLSFVRIACPYHRINLTTDFRVMEKEEAVCMNCIFFAQWVRHHLRVRCTLQDYINA